MLLKKEEIIILRRWVQEAECVGKRSTTYEL